MQLKIKSAENRSASRFVKVIALDPDWARRRYEQAVAERKVIGRRDPDGSANLSGLNLPLDRVAAASGHIDALAKAAKHAGDSRPIDHIRADLFLGMTDGTYTGLDDAAILEHLRTTHGNEDGPGDGTEGDGPDDDPGGPDNGGPAGGADGGAGGVGSSVDELALHGLAGAGMELRVRLSTLLGRDQYPTELAGWGPMHADLARDLAATLDGAQWRFAITDEHGQLLHCGITRARPTGTPIRMTSCRAIVELQIPAATLHAFGECPIELGAWARVVTDLLHQLDRGTAGRDCGTHRRTPSAALRRYLEIRDRYCTMIGCRVPARGADKDHTRDHAKGGPTIAPNLGDACRHDHRLKHEGGWTLHQNQPGIFRWTTVSI